MLTGLWVKGWNASLCSGMSRSRGGQPSHWEIGIDKQTSGFLLSPC